MAAYNIAEMFPWDEVFQLDQGQNLTKHDIASGRSITLTFNRGAYLQVTGNGVPNPITLCCDGDDVNAVALCLLTGRFK